MIIDLVVGARPNFVKAAALLHAAKKYPSLCIRLIHTGQHGEAMSDPYFKDLDLPQPIYPCEDFKFFPAAVRFGRMIEGLASRWYTPKHDFDLPDYVMVVGDTDSTAAGAIAAAKCGLPVIHVEAGLRIGDMKMQEEANRVLVDSIAIKHYTTSMWAQNNLAQEGKKGVLVGNVMIDTLRRFLPLKKIELVFDGLNYCRRAMVTLHRAENVDDPVRFTKIMNAVQKIAEMIPVVWPVHPRLGDDFNLDPVICVSPMGYREFLTDLNSSEFVMTDSGGVQEEASALGVPCMTFRDNTERWETVYQGTNTLVGCDENLIVDTAKRYLDKEKLSDVSEIFGYDGHAAERLLEDLCATL